jgi:hypothetical protein
MAQAALGVAAQVIHSGDSSLRETTRQMKITRRVNDAYQTLTTGKITAMADAKARLLAIAPTSG